MAAFGLSYEGLTRSDIRHIYSYNSPRVYIPAPRHFGRCRDLQPPSLLQRYPPRFYDYYPAFNVGLPRAPAFDNLPAGSIRELVERMRRPIACQRGEAAEEEKLGHRRSRSEDERDRLSKKKVKTVRFRSPCLDCETGSDQGEEAAARQLSSDVDKLQQVVSAEVRLKDWKRDAKSVGVASKGKSSDKDTSSDKDKSSAKENSPSKDKSTGKESPPSKHKSSTKERPSSKDKSSTKESSPSKDKPSTKESSPFKDKSSAKESSPSKDKSTAKRSSVASKDKSSTNESLPSKDKSPTKENSQAKDKSPVTDSSLHQQSLKLPELGGKKAGEKPMKQTGRFDRKSGGFKSLSLPPIRN